ncbi:MAG: bifunctional riboflavin kinase/FAD synthetase [Thermoanaerobaculia bacterium]
MLTFLDPLKQSDLPRECVATIGNFDGMHIGHQTIIRDVVERGRDLGLPAVVITFQPHPLSVVAPDRVPKQIMTLAQKEELIARSGADATLVIPFTPEFSRWTAREFVETFLVQRLGVREVWIGRDFCFGAGREGDLNSLTEMGHQHHFAVQGIDDIRIGGVRVSSSLIRRAIQKGAMHYVSLALGRTYSIDGSVETGMRLGRRIGFPTVNVEPENELFPGSAVYVTTCQFETFAGSFQSVTNIGVRPTLYENFSTTIESHILDFDSNVYGDRIRVYFHRLLRREKQFRSALELTNQIRMDIDQTRRYFREHPFELTPSGQ